MTARLLCETVWINPSTFIYKRNNSIRFKKEDIGGVSQIKNLNLT